MTSGPCSLEAASPQYQTRHAHAVACPMARCRPCKDQARSKLEIPRSLAEGGRSDRWLAAEAGARLHLMLPTSAVVRRFGGGQPRRPHRRRPGRGSRRLGSHAQGTPARSQLPEQRQPSRSFGSFPPAQRRPPLQALRLVGTIPKERRHTAPGRPRPMYIGSGGSSTPPRAPSTPEGMLCAAPPPRAISRQGATAYADGRRQALRRSSMIETLTSLTTTSERGALTTTSERIAVCVLMWFLRLSINALREPPRLPAHRSLHAALMGRRNRRVEGLRVCVQFWWMRLTRLRILLIMVWLSTQTTLARVTSPSCLG